MAMARAVRLLLVLAFAGFLTACSDGPEPERVRAAVQQQLDSALGARVLEIVRFRPAGGAPLREPDGRLVYFNAQLALVRDYDFTGWESHSVATLAALLGAGPKGIVGLDPDGNSAGDTIGVYGSAAFMREGDQWRLQARAPSGAVEAASDPPVQVAAVPPRAREAQPPGPLELALAELEAILRAPAVSISESERDAIVIEEAERAVRAVRQRLARADDRIAVAGGPAGGAYAEVLAALGARADAAGLSFHPRTSEGSIANLRLLRERSAQFALAQNDLARSAMAGEGRFAGSPVPGLRAVASLFPEPVHLVAAAGVGIASVADLRGKRVNLGAPGSGTRANALSVLAAHGLSVDALGQAASMPVPEAAAAMAEGRLDASFATIHAPARDLQRLAARMPVAFVPIGPSPELIAAGLVPLTLPARSYPNQAGPVPTVAATALLVTRDDVADAQVDAILALLFERREGSATTAVAQISRRTALAGVMLPWHPRAEAYLGGAGTTSSR